MAKKELLWKGLSEEQVKELDLSQFKQLVTSRLRRSLNRGFTDAQKILLKNLDTGKDRVKTHCRDMVILPTMLGKTILVYTGKAYAPVLVTIEMIGHTLGEFSHTRRLVSHSSAGVGATRSSKAVSAR